MPSPSKNKRGSLLDQFPSLEIESSASTIQKSARRMSSCLKGTFSRGFPPSIRGNSGFGIPQNRPFTLRMTMEYREYGPDWRLGKDNDKTAEVSRDFSYAKEIIEEIQQMIKAKAIEPEDLEDIMIDLMCRAIYGSNKIERAGLGLDETRSLCSAVLRGEEHLEWSDRTEEYQERLNKFARKNIRPGEEKVLRSRAEVIQHAAAFQYIVNDFVKHDQPMTEQLIKDTHNILVTGLDAGEAGVLSSKELGGRYRACNERAFAGAFEFTKVSQIPKAMKSMVDGIKEDMEEIEKAGVLDPYSLAARYCDRFVQIHPFRDGNGRMCRLILNAILLKYGGHVVILGEKDDDRDDYLGVATESGKVGGHPGQLAKMVLERAKFTLENMRAQALKRRLARESENQKAELKQT